MTTLGRAGWRVFSVAVLLAGLGWTWLARVPASAAGGGQIASPRAGFPAPDFTLNTPDGRPLTLSHFRGQVVIVNLWASWCLPCRAEMPALQAVYEAKQASGLVVLAVNSTVQDQADAAIRFASERGLSFPILLDPRGEVSRRYRLTALPTTFFVDRRGIIREVVVGGPMRPATIESLVDALLAEAP